MRQSWDEYFMDLCDAVAKRSKDPSTKVGAVVVRPDNTRASDGYNGFPRGVHDTEERLNDRPTKYKFVCHAEANAIVTAREPLHGYTLYVSPLHPCHECAKLVIQSGIKRVVTRKPEEARWMESYDTAQTMFREAGVELEFQWNEPPKPVCDHVFLRDLAKGPYAMTCSRCGATGAG